MKRRVSTLVLLFLSTLAGAQTDDKSYYYGQAMKDKLNGLNSPSPENLDMNRSQEPADVGVDLLSDVASWGPGSAKRCPVHGPFEITVADGGGVRFKPHPRKWSSATTRVSGAGATDGIWLKYSGVDADKKWELVARTEERRKRFVHPLHDLHKQPEANGVFIPWTSFVGQETSIGKVKNVPSMKLDADSVRSVGFIRHYSPTRGRNAATPRHPLTVSVARLTKASVAQAGQAAMAGSEAPQESKYHATVTV